MPRNHATFRSARIIAIAAGAIAVTVVPATAQAFDLRPATVTRAAPAVSPYVVAAHNPPGYAPVAAYPPDTYVTAGALADAVPPDPCVTARAVVQAIPPDPYRR
jgi:hypothetical protein